MKKLLVLLMFLGFVFATDIPVDWVDGNPLYASDMNQLKNSRAGSMKPINPTSNIYEDGTQDLGSGLYRWRNGFFSGSIVANNFTDFGDGSEGDFIATANSTLDGLHMYNNVTITSSCTVNIGSRGFLTLLVKGTLTLGGAINGQGKGGASGSGGALSNKGGNGGAGLFSGSTGGSGGNGSQGGSVATGGSGGTVSTFFPLLGGVQPDGNGNTTGQTGTSLNIQTINWYRNLGMVGYGSGGGGGGGGLYGSGYGGAGGAGGGGLIIHANNIVVSGTPSINCSGSNGLTSDLSAQSAGGGGGGGGGACVIIYKSIIGSIPTPNVSGGAGGGVGYSGYGGAGGVGGSGWYSVISL